MTLLTHKYATENTLNSKIQQISTCCNIFDTFTHLPLFLISISKPINLTQWRKFYRIKQWSSFWVHGPRMFSSIKTLEESFANKFSSNYKKVWFSFAHGEPTQQESSEWRSLLSLLHRQMVTHRMVSSVWYQQEQAILASNTNLHIMHIFQIALAST